MDEQLLKPISEVSYLTVGNAWRYRAVLRYFYDQHERLRHYLFPEEILEHLRQSPHFHDYSAEQLQQDLNQLVEWKNLIPRQDTGKVTSIEEFKKKRFRYQSTPYTIEIERMVQQLEQMGESFGGSLEKTLFDRLLASLNRLVAEQGRPVKGDQEKKYAVDRLTGEALNALWSETYESFRKLTENATDYLAHLQSERVEELMMTEAFLSYKEAITQYLRDFMTVLQRTSLHIETLLRETPPSLIERVAGRLADHYLSIPRLEEPRPREDVAERYLVQWQALKDWFLGSGGRESDLVYLQNATNETIRRITRFAQRLGEQHHSFRSRKRDYLHIAGWFAACTDLQAAHELSAVVFGAFHTRHLYAAPKETEDIYAEIWDQPPTEITLNPRIRMYREKTRPNAAASHKDEKARVMAEYLRQKEAERTLIERLMRGNRIVVGELPVVDPHVRKTLLYWIARCMGSRDWVGKTETGRSFRLAKIDDHEVVLRSEDGNLRMPNYVLQFME
ncbi:MAG: TIGR02677 family protein [Desulforudis sp.]|nr:MAG: TIGR02677 family protein [Desulforudis sp.]